MTRCFGDQIAKYIGVTSHPDIQFFEVKQKDKILLIASDGIWDVLKKEDITSCIMHSQVGGEA